MMSHECVVPSWNNVKQGEEGNRSSHVDFNPHLFFPQNSSQIAPMSNYEVTELTWENGQLAMHELGGVGHAGDTLESIVHQATYCNTLHPNPNPTPIMAATADQNSGQNMNKAASFGSPSLGKWADNSDPVQNPAPLPPPPSGPVKKRSHSETEQYSRLPNDLDSACASANAAFCRDNNDTTMMTWASYESPRSCTRTKTTTDEDSACQGGSFMQGNHEEDRETKGETGRSFTTRKGRAAAVHNQSERRRRDRINQKMKALQKLVPNASKPKQTDKASMLDEVIDYLKQLQAQVQMMSSARFMPQMMMPAAAAAALGMQQQLQQMSLLARMGIRIGMMDTPTPNIPQTLTPAQLVHPSQVAPASSGFVPPGAFVVPPMIPQANPSAAGPSSSAPLQDHYAALLAQSMNMDLYNTMAALQRQQQQTPQQPTSTQLQLNHHIQGGQGN